MSSISAEWTDEGSVDLRAIAVTLWAKRWWLLASGMLLAVIAGIIAFTMTPIYRAKVVLVPTSTERGGLDGGLGAALGQLGGLASMAGLNLGNGAIDKEEALAVLRSQQFTQRFIDDLGLMPELFAEKWDAAAGTWRKDVKPPTPGKAYRLFDRTIRAVTQDKKTGLVTLQVEWRDRNKAALWANELVERLNAEMRSRAIATSDASVGYLEKELNATSVVSTREAINRLIEAQIKQRMLANVSQEYSFRIADRAIAPDADDKVRPKRLVMVILGFCIGTVVGGAAILLLASMRARPIGAQ
jgi:uncharacterized protein involved in exopolysaccharide biosynthesis